MDDTDLSQSLSTTGSDADNAGKFTYTPLSDNEVRLVRLRMVTDHDKTIRVDLITAEWPPPLPYEALSYVWGDPANQPSILISAEDDPLRPFQVTQNLHAALYHLRREDCDRVLWIDALCIDQTNMEEKEQQVRKMDQIYQTASNVCVWLGTGMPHGMKQIPVIIQSIWNLPLTHHSAHVIWKPFECLLQKDWFSRRWVIQEVALAKKATVHCGSAQVSWTDFSDAISVYGSRSTNTVSQIPRSLAPFPNASGLGALTLGFLSNNALRKDDEGNVVERRWNIEDLLAQLPMFHAQLPHDTLFAVLSLASDRAAFQHVDYSMPQVELFARVLQQIAESTKSLDMMFRPWAPETPGARLPSFIAPASRHPYIRDGYGLYRRCNADSLVGPPRRPIYAATSALSFPALPKPNDHVNQPFNNPERKFHSVLTVRGVVCGVVSELSDVCEDGIIPWSWLETWKPGEQRLQHDIWRVLVAGRSQDGMAAPNWYRRAFEHVFDPAGDCSGVGKAKGLGLNLPDIIEAHQTNNVAEFLRRVSACVWGRRFLASTCERPGYFGLVPREAALGDMICLLDGCSVPVIFRGKPMTQFVLQSLRRRFGSQGPAGHGFSPATEEWFVSQQKRAVSQILRLWGLWDQRKFTSPFWPRFDEIAGRFWKHVRRQGFEKLPESQARDKLRRLLEFALRDSIDVTLRRAVVQGAAEGMITLGLKAFFRDVIPEALGHPLDADLFPADSTHDLSWADTLVRQLFRPLFVRGFEEAIEKQWQGDAYANLRFEISIGQNTGARMSVDERRLDAAFKAVWASAWSSVWDDSRHLVMELWSGELDKLDRVSWTEPLHAAAEGWVQTWRREPVYRGEVIGQCYIQGLMEGEWWSGNQATEEEVKILVID